MKRNWNYVTEGLRREEILDFMLRDFDCYAWSIRTLDRRLRYYDVRYTDTDVADCGWGRGGNNARNRRSRQTAWLQGNAEKAKTSSYANLVWCGWSAYDSFNRIHFIFMLLMKIGRHSSHYSCFRPFVNPDNTSHYFGVKQVLQIEPANYIRIIISHPNLHPKQFPTTSINAAINCDREGFILVSY